MAFDPKDTCRRLLEANSEADAAAIIEGSPTMRDPANWRPLDGRETNFNVTSNQASDGGKALTELMTNMVDAVLMRHALERGIDPRSPQAPQSMYEAVDRLVHNLHGGKLTSLGSDDRWLKDFSAKNLVIGVTGARSRKDGLPCYVFVDNGEGQRPEDFHRTFLSLSAGTKSSIPFVQGKYNMGSSGVLGYCGRRWYKLIVSRKWDEKHPWGWTLMRRRPVREVPVSRCDAPSCNEPIKRGMLMCRAHWFRLPRELRAAISTTWAARRTGSLAAWSANVLAARSFLANNSPAALAARITGDPA